MHMDESQKTEVLVLGAGITGLAAGYALQQAKIDYRVLEAAPQAGGVLQSSYPQGYTLDHGANSLALNPALEQLIADLGLEDRMAPATAASQQRLIYRDGRLHPVVPSPVGLLKTSLLSWRGKLRLFSEPWRKSEADGEDSVAAFFTRRLGREAYQFLVEPILTGIYAGNGKQMSADAIFPRLKGWEREHGSLFRGLMASRKEKKDGGGLGRRGVASLQGGMHTLTSGLAKALGERLCLETVVQQVEAVAGGFVVTVDQKGKSQKISAAQVIWTLPATAAQALQPLDAALAQSLSHISYSPMLMLSLGYKEEEVARPLDSFGFLVPGAEELPLLGAIWNSTIFPDKAPKGEALFTLFIGGARQKGADEATLLELSEEAREKFEYVMGILGEPVLRKPYYWPRAIPQYEVGELEMRAQATALEERFPGLHMAGNWLRGVSVGDCVQAGQAASEQCASHRLR